MKEQPYEATAKSQLRRLATLTDVVYAVGLVMIIQWLPLPEESHSDGAVWLGALWAEYSDNIIAVIIGLVFTIIYWLRSNTLMTALDRTDGVHTGLSIASVFCLLLLLYVVRVSGGVTAPSRRAGESLAPRVGSRRTPRGDLPACEPPQCSARHRCMPSSRCGLPRTAGRARRQPSIAAFRYRRSS